MKIPTDDGVVNNRQTAGQMSSIMTDQAVSTVKLGVNIADKWMDERAESLAQETRNNYQKSMNDLTLKYQQKKGKDAIGSTQEFIKESQSLEKEMTGSLGKRSRVKLGDYTTRVNESYRMNLMQHERQQETEFNKGEFEKGLTLSQEMIRQDAKNYPNAITHLDQTMEAGLKAGLWTPEEHDTKRTEITNKFRNDLGKNYYTQDKHDFMRNIGGFGFGKPEVEAYKQRYKNDLESEAREKKSLFAEEAKLLMGKRDDMKAQAIANEDISHYEEAAKKLDKMGYSAWGTELREEAGTYKQVIGFSSENKNKSLAEIKNAALSLEIPEGLDGSSAAFKSREAIRKTVSETLKFYDKDPAAYVAKQAQGSNMEEMVSSRLSLQESQGIYPSSGFRALTADENKTLKGTWESGDAKQKAGMVLGVREKFGKHTPKVLEELKINHAVVLGSYLEDEKDVEMLVSAVSSKPVVLDDAAKSDYTSAAKGSDFYKLQLKVQSTFPTNPDLPQKIGDIETAMTGISARKVDPSAGAQFFDERFETIESRDKLVYFPKGHDGDDLEDIMDAKKAKLAEKFKSGKEIVDTRAGWSVRDAVWVNSGKGFVLADPRSGTYIPGSEIDMMKPEIESVPEKTKVAKTKDGDLVTYSRR